MDPRDPGSIGQSFGERDGPLVVSIWPLVSDGRPWVPAEHSNRSAALKRVVPARTPAGSSSSSPLISRDRGIIGWAAPLTA